MTIEIGATMQRYRIGWHLAAFILTVVFGAGALGSQARSRIEEEPQREQWQRVTDIFRAMDDPALRISIADFDRLAKSGPVTLIDVRDEGMFAKGHLPDAILIPVDTIEASASRLQGLKEPFITYCS